MSRLFPGPYVQALWATVIPELDSIADGKRFSVCSSVREATFIEFCSKDPSARLRRRDRIPAQSAEWVEDNICEFQEARGMGVREAARRE